MKTFVDDIDVGRSACGHYKEETTCENRFVSSSITIFTQKKAPVAARTPNTSNDIISSCID